MRRLASGGPALVLGAGRNPINFVSADDVAAFICLAVDGDHRIGEELSVGGPEDLSFVEIADLLIAHSLGGQGTRHVPLPVLRAMSVLARPVRPAFARQAGAAVVMNTTDMSFDDTPVARTLSGDRAHHPGQAPGAYGLRRTVTWCPMSDPFGPRASGNL